MLFEAAVGSPALLVQDANGARLHLGFAPVVGATAAWSMKPGMRFTLGARASAGNLTGSDDGASWDVGRASLASVHIGLLQDLGTRFGSYASGGPTFLFGPNGVTPFADATSPYHWGLATGFLWKVGGTRPLAATIGVEGFIVGGATLSDPVEEPGWVSRFTMGVRYGR